MKIAFVTPYYNPQDVRRGSGTFYYLSKEIERQGWIVDYFGPLKTPNPLPTRVLRYFTKNILSGRYISYLDPLVAKDLGHNFSKDIQDSDVELILTNDPGIVAGLHTNLPIIYYSDVVYPFSLDKTELNKITALHNVPNFMLKMAQATIKKCLHRSSICIFPTEHLSNEAQKYGVDPAKLHVIPFGANIPDPGKSVTENRDFYKIVLSNTLNLLFVGKDWKRKGGNTAIEVTESLREHGVETKLHLVGVDFENMPSYIEVHGLLNKNETDEWMVLDQLYRQSDILIFPSLSEGSAIVPREAAAYGLPTLAYDIDGIETSIINRQSGILLPVHAEKSDFVQIILNWFKNPGKYNELAKSTRIFYENSAKWEILVRKFVNLIEANLTTEDNISIQQKAERYS